MGAVPDSAVRLCDWPGCTAWFDADAALCGRARYPGWLRHAGYRLDLCGVHAPLAWGPDGTWHRATGSSGAVCGCGAALAPAGPTLGDLAAAYRRHLALAVGASDELRS